MATIPRRGPAIPLVQTPAVDFAGSFSRGLQLAGQEAELEDVGRQRRQRDAFAQALMGGGRDAGGAGGTGQGDTQREVAALDVLADTALRFGDLDAFTRGMRLKVDVDKNDRESLKFALESLGPLFRVAGQSPEAFQAAREIAVMTSPRVASLIPETFTPGAVQALQQFGQDPSQLFTDLTAEQMESLGLPSGTVAQRSGTGALAVRQQSDVRSPEAQAQAIERAQAGRSSTTVNVDTGRQPQSKGARTETEKDLQAAEESLGRLDRIAETFDPEFLTLQGRAEAGIDIAADRLGLSSQAQQQRIRQRRAFSQGVNREFNAYRRVITGAAAALAELESLKDATLNTDQSPTEFISSFDEYRRELERGIQVRRELLREGVDVSNPEFGERFDQRFLGGREREASIEGGPDLANMGLQELLSLDPGTLTTQQAEAAVRRIQELQAR